MTQRSRALTQEKRKIVLTHTHTEWTWVFTAALFAVAKSGNNLHVPLKLVVYPYSETLLVSKEDQIPEKHKAWWRSDTFYVKEAKLKRLWCDSIHTICWQGKTPWTGTGFLGWGLRWELDCAKGQEGTVWGCKAVLHPVCSSGYALVCVCQNPWKGEL